MAVKQDFKAKLDFLFEEKGIRLSAIANAVGVRVDKIKSIRAGRSSGDGQMLALLEKEFGSLLNNHDSIDRVDNLEERLKRLEEENAEMRKTIMEIARQQLRQMEKMETK